MNILVISDFFPHAFRPHEGIFVWEQVRELARRHSVVVIAPRVWYPPLKRYAALRFPVSSVPFLEKKEGILILRPVYRTIPLVGERMVPLWFFLKLLLFLSLFSVSFDLIHAHWAYRAGWWAVLLGRLLRKPVVLTAHGSDINYWMNEPVKKTRIRWALRQASGVIFVSRKLAAKVPLKGIRLKKLRVIPNGIPVQDLRGIPEPQLLPVPCKKIVFVGNLFPVKGVDRLLKALHLLKQTDVLWQANLIGDGPERQALEQKTRALGLEEKVTFCGWLPHPEAMRKLEEADVLVIPSRNEGGPLVLIEGLARGKTVVSFDVGIVAEVLYSPSLGYVVKEHTPEALAAAIRKAFKKSVNPKTAKKAAAKYLLKNTVRQIEAFYKTVLTE